MPLSPKVRGEKKKGRFSKALPISPFPWGKEGGKKGGGGRNEA